MTQHDNSSDPVKSHSLGVKPQDSIEPLARDEQKEPYQTPPKAPVNNQGSAQYDPLAPAGGKWSQWAWFIGLSGGGLLLVLFVAKLIHIAMFAQID